MFLKKLINKGYEANECQLCRSQFNMLKFDRIHKCKRCLKFVCLPCGDFKGLIIDEEGKQSRHRVCLNCKHDIQLINDTIAKYTMRWERDSLLSREWLTAIKTQNAKNYEYSHFLNYFHKSGSKFNDQCEIIAKDVIRGRTDFSVFNYSMKQFFYTIQNIQQLETTRLNIANVLYAVAARYDKVGYCQGMSGIAAFLLCFAQQATAFVIFCDLIDNIFPAMFLERSEFGVALIGLLAETHFLKEYYWLFFNSKRQLLMHEMQEWFTSQQQEHTKMIIELAGTKALLSVFIGVLNFTNLIFLWEELKNKRSFEVVERAFLAVIYLNRKNILQERSFKKLEAYFEMLDSEAFKEAYADIAIDPAIRQRLVGEFYKENKTKWSSSKNGNAYTLSKVTNLSENEIRMLQKALCVGYSNEELITKVVLDQQEFIRIIGVYSQVLKSHSSQGERILELTPLIIRKIYCAYAGKPAEGLTFREFIGCFSICTKSCLKDRLGAILNTLKNKGRISYQSLRRMMNSFINMAPKRLQNAKQYFVERMTTFFVENGSISSSEVQLLLSDVFINEMNSYIRCDCEGIIEMVFARYLEEKEIKVAKEAKEEAKERKVTKERVEAKEGAVERKVEATETKEINEATSIQQMGKEAVETERYFEMKL